MKTKRNQRTILAAMTFLSVIAVLIPSLFNTAAAPPPQCPLDQSQLQHNGAVPFGGNVLLAQTFIPSPALLGKRVCRVKVMIRKNLAGAGPLRLTLLRSNFAPLDAAVVIAPPAALGDSVQVFDFGCNGAPVAGVPFYGMKLEAPGSPANAYSWHGTGGNAYVKPGIGGQGWRKVGGGNMAALAGGNWDYYFQIYMCNP